MASVVRARVPIRVVVVDDYRTVLWGLEKLVDSERPRMQCVGGAASRVEAVKIAEKALPDVVLLDLDLGDESGLDAIPQLLASCNGRVLALTDARDPALHDRAVLAGAYGVVHKESAPEVILKAIECVHAGELWLDRAAAGRLVSRLARQSPAAETEAPVLDKLTAREREIVEVIAHHAGANTKVIAEMLRISEHTVRNHLSSIYDKLGVLNRVQLFAYANRRVARQ